MDDDPDTADGGDQHPKDRLDDHLHDIDDRADEMQERLDELGEGIDAARRRAEADELIPGGPGDDESASLFDRAGLPEGDEERETPLNDADFEAGM